MIVYVVFDMHENEIISLFSDVSDAQEVADMFERGTIMKFELDVDTSEEDR